MRFVEHTRAGQARRSQDDRVALPLEKLAKAGFDVAAERDETQVGPLALKLHHATAGRRANLGAPLQRSQIGTVDGEQHIARIFANGHAEDPHPFGEWNIAGHVFQRMNCEIRLAAHDHRLDLTHEQPLATHFGERAILDAVAPTGLNESKIAPACCNA
jgi:hypothetical protein